MKHLKIWIFLLLLPAILFADPSLGTDATARPSTGDLTIETANLGSSTGEVIPLAFTTIANEDQAQTAVDWVTSEIKETPVGDTTAILIVKEAPPEAAETCKISTPKNSEDKELLAELKRLRKNDQLARIRLVGVLTGITLSTCQMHGWNFKALAPGFTGAAMSWGLQQINDPFQAWLVSGGTHWSTFKKLLLTTLVYISALKGANIGVGIEEFTTYTALIQEVGLSVLLGASLEYSWDRYISESRHTNIENDPQNATSHRARADKQAATVSVIGTTAQAASVGGDAGGYISGGIMLASGLATYAWYVGPKKIWRGFKKKCHEWVLSSARGEIAM